MIRSKPTRITLGDEDLRFHLQRLLARHTRLAEWHQHDQYLNGSDFDENEDDAFLESDSDLFSPPDFSPSRSVCGSNPDGFPEDSSSTPRGGGRGNNTGSRPAFPSEESTGSSSASASSSLDADQPVIVLSSSLSLLELGGSAADQGTADTRSEFQPSTESGDGSSSQSRIAAQGLYSPPGHYVIRESSLSHCITPARAGSDEVSCEDTGSHSLECDSQISLPSVSHTSLHQPELSSPAFRSVSSETRTMIPISSLLEEQTMRHSEDSSQIHTPPGAVHEARGSSSEDKIHPEMAPVAQSEQSAEPTTLEANKSNAITDGVKKKSRALIRSTHGQRARIPMVEAVLSRDRQAVEGHDAKPSSDTTASVAKSQLGVRPQPTDTRLLGSLPDAKKFKHTRRPSKMVKFKGLSRAVDKPIPHSQIGADPSLEVTGQGTGTSPCQHQGDPQASLVNGPELRQENQAPRSDLVSTTLAQLAISSGSKKPNTPRKSNVQDLIARPGAPTPQNQSQDGEAEVRMPSPSTVSESTSDETWTGQDQESTLHPIDVEAREFAKYVNLMMKEMFPHPESLELANSEWELR